MIKPLSSWVRGVAIATAVTAITLALLIICAEEIPALKDWLKITFYHHWLGKSAIALITFTATMLFAQITKSEHKLSTYILVEIVVVIASVGIIAGFFLLHALKMF